MTTTTTPGTTSPAAVHQWSVRLGWIPPRTVFVCDQPQCQAESIRYRVEYTAPGHATVRRHHCANHAAALAHRYGLPFPPTAWVDSPTGG